MFDFYNLSIPEAEAYCNEHKDIVKHQYTFRTDYCQFEKEFAHRTLRYIVTKYKQDVWGHRVPAEILRYKIAFFQCLSLGKDYIFEHLDEIDWTDISRTVKLNEKFLREFADYIDWKEVCKHQKLKKPFIIEMKKYTKKYMKDYFNDSKKR